MGIDINQPPPGNRGRFFIGGGEGRVARLTAVGLMAARGAGNPTDS